MAEIIDIKGVGPVLAKACTDNGYGSIGKIATAMLSDLVAVPGVSEAKAKILIGAAQALLRDQPSPNGAAPSGMEAKLEETQPKEAKPEGRGKKKKTKKSDDRKKGKGKKSKMKKRKKEKKKKKSKK